MQEPSLENEILITDDLPTSDDQRFEALAKSYITISSIGWAVAIILMIAVNVIINTLNGDGFAWFLEIRVMAVVLGILFVLVILAIAIPRLLWRSQGYQLRDRDIHHKHGVVWRAVTSLPYVRVQHVELESGPLERFFKLATLKFYTAGGGSADMKIPGLPFAAASKIRSFVLEQAGQEAGAEHQDG